MAIGFWTLVLIGLVCLWQGGPAHPGLLWAAAFLVGGGLLGLALMDSDWGNAHADEAALLESAGELGATSAKEESCQ